jgi:hypothetical protein
MPWIYAALLIRRYDTAANEGGLLESCPTRPEQIVPFSSPSRHQVTADRMIRRRQADIGFPNSHNIGNFATTVT